MLAHSGGKKPARWIAQAVDFQALESSPCFINPLVLDQGTAEGQLQIRLDPTGNRPIGDQRTHLRIELLVGIRSPRLFEGSKKFSDRRIDLGSDLEQPLVELVPLESTDSIG